jgi:hypothetical protein
MTGAWSVRAASLCLGAALATPPSSIAATGRADVEVVDWKGAWIAGPERSLVERTPEQGLANDELIRVAGEPCRPTAWPTVPLMTRAPIQRMVDGHAVYAVGSGEYHFLTPNEGQGR